MTVYRILYRGSLSSCNYSCDYCPFAKTANTREELLQDAREVERFVEWVGNANRTIGILFTPWGEAIVHAHYRQAMVRMSHMPHVQRVAMQTNLSTSRLADFTSAQRDSLAFWTTFHPGQTSLARFVERCEELEDMKLHFSVGVVGLREHFDAISELRCRLSPDVYLWINSYKRESKYYREDDLSFLRQIDPYFDLNRHHYSSQGRACRAGDSTFTVDARGEVRRCHFIDEPIGNIYCDDIFECLRPRTCTNATCGCHIGYVHRPELNLYALFGENVLERIPIKWPLVDTDFVELDSLRMSQMARTVSGKVANS
jgi:MoaA/NifB/PqqE/SkfB family radical SAM enzyme